MTNLQEEFFEFSKKIDCDVYFNEPLKKHCTFKIGGNAEILVIPNSEKALSAIVVYASDNNITTHILGNGSNVLISDEGLSGITIKLLNGLTDIIYLGDGVIACGAGVSLKRLCSFALEKSLTGLEFAYGIPGSVGGALYMNAGAYGGEIKDVLISIRSIDRKTGIPAENVISELTYEYRNTSFMTNDRIITAAYFVLEQGDSDEISAKMSELLSKRKHSQPLEYPSAGSTFKRPKNGYAAAHIDECGLKGLSVGGASVSEKHAGFVINRDNATFDDVMALIKKVQDTVYNMHGVMLEREVEILTN